MVNDYIDEECLRGWSRKREEARLRLMEFLSKPNPPSSFVSRKALEDIRNAVESIYDKYSILEPSNPKLSIKD